MAEWEAAHRPPLGAVQTHRCEDADEILVAMGTIADTAAGRGGPSPRAPAGRVGCLAVTSFRPFPPRRRSSAHSAARGRRRRRAHGRARRGRQPADPRSRRRPCSPWRPTAAPVPRVRSVVGRSRVTRRLRGRSGRRVRLAGRPAKFHTHGPYAVLGVRHPLALPSDGPYAGGRPAPTACAVIRSAGSAPSPPTSCWRRSPVSSSAAGCRPTHATDRRRRACRRRTT